MSAGDFQQRVLFPYLRSTGVAEADLGDVASFAAERFGSLSDPVGEPESALLDEFPRQLEQTLLSGDFRLVVAAPSIPSSVQQVIEYLNSRGLLIYGLEVSFFSGPAECFVPRLVVKPQVSETKRLSASPASLDEGEFLHELPERVQPAAEMFLRSCETAAATIRWNSYGPSIRASRTPERVVAWLEKRRVVIVVTAPAGYPPSPFIEARSATGQFVAGKVSSDDWNWSVRYEDVSDEDLAAIFSIALGLVASLAVQVEFVQIGQPLDLTFHRNDNNIWAKSVPGLEPHLGHWLRGTLTAVSQGVMTAVVLEPLAGGSPGWKPRFASAEDTQSVWPTGDFAGEFRLMVTEVANASPKSAPAS